MDLDPKPVTITFTGRAARTAPMTWGQRSIYAPIRWLGDDAWYFNLTRVVEAPPGTREDQACAALAALLARHEGLRSSFHETDDDWVQRVRAEGATTVHVTSADPSDAPEVAHALAARLAQHTFRHDDELPVRFGLVVAGPRSGQGDDEHAGTQVTHVVVAVSHLAADGWAADLLKRDVERLLDGSAEAPPQWQPVDQARHELAGPGAARGDAALAYWSRTLEAIPHAPFPPAEADGKPDRFVKLGISSRALAVAATVVAGRCGVSTGTVLLTASVVVLGRLIGQDRVALELIASNRLDERSRGLVAPLAENALFVVDLAGADDFRTAARRTFAAGLSAYRHAQYDPQARDRLVAQTRERHGGGTGLGSFFNDMRIGRDWAVDVDAYGSLDAVRALTAQTTTSFVGSWDRQDATWFVSVDDADGTCGLYLMADTELVPRHRVEELLREMESVVVEAVAG